MNQTIDRIIKDIGGVIGIDGATNRLFKSIFNVIVHLPIPCFIESLQSDIRREITANVVQKIVDVKKRLDEMVGFDSSYAFISYSCNGMRDVIHKLLQQKVFMWVSGCDTHCIQNLSLDLVKMPEFSSVIKNAMFVSKTVKNVGIIRKMFYVICNENLVRLMQ